MLTLRLSLPLCTIPIFPFGNKKPLTKEQVISKCKENHLFDENKDAKDAYVVEHPLTEDIVKYKHPCKI